MNVRLFTLGFCTLLTLSACSEPAPDPAEQTADEFAFTEEDIVRFRELVMNEKEGTTSGTAAVLGTPHLVAGTPATELADSIPVLDLSKVSSFNTIRSQAEEGDVFRVTNDFLNLRAAPRVTAEQLGRLQRGDVMNVMEFTDAAWAKVQLPNGREGYVSARYIAKVTSENKLSEEKAKYDGLYFVNFGFLNVRANPDSQSEKLGELPGQAIIRIISQDEVWARVPFESREGYVAVQYLKPFVPNFLVRQETYRLPVLHYDLERPDILGQLEAHLSVLRSNGVSILTLEDFKDLLVRQEEKDVRLDPNAVVLAISDVTATNIEAVRGALSTARVNASLFIQTNQIGIGGITEQTLLTLVSDGHDVQSAGHTGDDLRSLTNAQVELELKQSRQLIESKTNQPVYSVLFPVGGVNDRVEELAASAGYLLGVSSASNPSFHRHQLLRMPSYSVNVGMTEEELLSIALDTTE